VPLTRRGITLAELLAALTLTGWLGTLTTRLLGAAAFQLRDRSERVSAEHNLRIAAGALRSALEPLGQDSLSGADLLTSSPPGFTARAVRAAGTLCAASPGALVVRAAPQWWSASRDPVAGRDSLLVGRLDVPGWRSFPLQTAPLSALCPDGSAAWNLSVTADSAALIGIGPGSPLRLFEGVEIRLYTSSPDQWTGLRLLATTQAIQPFAGPMQSSGLSLSYERRDGSPAGSPDEVAGVSFRLGMLTERAGGVGLIRGPVPRADSMSGFVVLQNHP